MSNLPPDNEDSADIDALYRRLSAADPSRPGEGVRQAVLLHAMHHARPAANDPAVRREYSWQRRERAWLRPTAFGALAAGILAVFMFGPQFSMQPQVAAPVLREDRAAGAPPVFADLTTSSFSKESRPLPATLESDAKVRQVPTDALRRQLTVPQAVDSETANTVASAAPAEQPRPAAARAEASGSLDTARAKADAAPAAAASATTTTAAAGTTAVRLRDDSGPMLWRAAENGDLPVLREMHEKHANLDVTDAGGRTALMIATLHGHSQAVSALLDYGADPNISDARGVSPLDAALAADESEIIAALKRHGGR